MPLRTNLARAGVLAVAALRTAHGFYVPGVRPHEFEPGEDVPMKVNSLTSIHTQVSCLHLLCRGNCNDRVARILARTFVDASLS